MKITTGLYAAETAFFALFRYYWGLGRPLIVGAALHNLFEWVIVILLAYGTNYKNVSQSVVTAIIWIISVVAVTLMVPGLLTAFLVEQSTGIMLDFAMPLMFLGKHFLSHDPQVRKFYRLPAIAHTLHILFTILPLVFANFHVGYTSWYSSFFLETAIYLSAPMTHILYCIWAYTYDKTLQETAELQGMEPRVVGEEEQHLSNGSNGSTTNAPRVSNGSSNGKKLVGDFVPVLLEDKLRIKDVKKYLIAGFVAGQIALVALPTLVLGECAPPPQCVPDGIITGTSIASVHPGMGQAFEDLVATTKLIERARSAPGNLDYQLHANVQDPNEFRFVEQWASREALENWVTKGAPAEIFASPNMKGLLVGGELKNMQGYYDYPKEQCHAKANGGVTFDVGSSCSKVWKVVGDWGNCDWVVGCKYASVVPNPGGDPKRVLSMENGQDLTVYQRQYSEVARKMIYEVSEPAFMDGYVGDISLQGNKTKGSRGCTVTYKFSVPKGPGHPSVEFVYDDFYQNRIPALQKMFSR